jgi:hypothetical protein
MAPDEIACSSATSIYEGVRLHRRLRKTAQDSERLSRLIGKDIVLKRANLNPEKDYLERRREVITAGAIVIAAALAMAMPALAVPVAQGTFSNFGNARVVIGGLYLGLAATELTSILCTSEAFIPNCDGLWSSQGNTSDSGIAWVPTTQPLLSTITLLYTFYNMGATDCRGGSPRFVIRLNDGMNSKLVGYLGLPPNFGNCPAG